MTLISRDPFARTELHRELVPAPGQSCAWCGSFRHNVASTHKLFRYSTETDGGRKHVHRGLFCSKSCHDDYHH
jgi:hypothetical protein